MTKERLQDAFTDPEREEIYVSHEIELPNGEKHTNIYAVIGDQEGSVTVSLIDPSDLDSENSWNEGIGISALPLADVELYEIKYDE